MNKPTISGIATLAFWSTFALLVVHTGATPGFLVGVLTFTIGGFAILLLEFIRTGQLLVFFRQPLWIYAFGVVGIGVYSLLFFAAFKLTSPFIANCLNYLWPILLTVFLAYDQRRKPGWAELLGMGMGFLGTVILFITRFDSTLQTLSGSDIAGCLAAFTAAVIWAAYSTLARRIKYPPGTTGVFFLIAAILAAGLHLAFEANIWPRGQEWVFIVLLGLGRLSYTVWDWAMKHGDQTMLTSLSYLVPLASVGWLILAGYLPAEPMAILAGFTIICGCIVTNFTKIMQGLKR